MPQYMLMVTEDLAKERERTPGETQALIEGRTAYEQELRALSVFLDGERLRPVSEGRRVSTRDGAARVVTGPFAEATLSGYYVVQADDLDAATKLAERCPVSPGSALDVRPLMKGSHNPEKMRQPGRVFGCAVLGNAANEPAWVDIMDRVDASSRDNFPTDKMCGGVRLHAPSTGRRIAATEGNQRAIFDGPFLESKEVIGGLFFLRMQTIDEVVAFAMNADFVRHGGVEIRELWRS